MYPATTKITTTPTCYLDFYDINLSLEQRVALHNYCCRCRFLFVCCALSVYKRILCFLLLFSFHCVLHLYTLHTNISQLQDNTPIYDIRSQSDDKRLDPRKVNIQFTCKQTLTHPHSYTTITTSHCQCTHTYIHAHTSTQSHTYIFVFIYFNKKINTFTIALSH